MTDNIINLADIRANTTLGLGTLNILPAAEDSDYEIADEHAAEPIKSLDTINQISTYLKDNERWRDNMLFIVGVNFGLRVSDLIELRFSHIINSNMTFKETFPVLEKKTKNTRKVKKNRYLTINDAIKEVVTLYLEKTPNVRLSDYMFRSESNNGGSVNKPITRQSVDRLLKEIAENLSLDERIATHTLRKTFAYHQMVMSGNDPRKLLLLQKMFGHSTSMQTLSYIGITTEEMAEAYKALNLGGKNSYLLDTNLVEIEEHIC